MNKIDMAFFPSVDGSIFSENGQTFMRHVKRPAGGDLLPGFRHSTFRELYQVREMGCGHVLLQRRQGAKRAAMLGPAPGSQKTDRRKPAARGSGKGALA
jgi:hypothetical protein